MKEEILAAKRHLYFLLLQLTDDELTDNEVELLFFLAKDEQVQTLFKTTN